MNATIYITYHNSSGLNYTHSNYLTFKRPLQPQTAKCENWALLFMYRVYIPSFVIVTVISWKNSMPLLIARTLRLSFYVLFEIAIQSQRLFYKKVKQCKIDLIFIIVWKMRVSREYVKNRMVLNILQCLKASYCSTLLPIMPFDVVKCGLHH